MAILVGILFCLAHPLRPLGNVALGEEAHSFSLEKRRGPHQVDLIAHPPEGYKVNLKFPQYIRTLEQKAYPKKMNASEILFVFEYPRAENKPIESESIRLNLAYCSQDLCRLDVRTVLWKDIPFAKDLKNQRTPSK